MSVFEFQNPSVLWFLVLGLVPLLIFLFLKRSPKIIHWGAMRFLRRAQEQVRRRSRFCEILRLFCQTVGIMALILAIASPSWVIDSEISQDKKNTSDMNSQKSTRTEKKTGGKSAFLLILDTSASMQETVRAEKAQRLASIQRGDWLSQMENSTGNEIHIITTGENIVADWPSTLEEVRKITFFNENGNENE
ncbi:MAG: BatA domain-containing protein, partial [Planctomycetia bacterium]|nr:BatA domain-containing protein [Planctomycetia bacterium]